jgi:ferredoxin-nitrite reductase
MRALLDAWKEDLRYRISRVKARMKFMVDDRGPEGMREEVERRLGYALPDYTLEPLDHDPADHMGVELEHEPGLHSIGAPVHLGLISGDQMLAVADLAATQGRDIRLTRQQNLIVTGITEVEGATTVLGEIGFPVDANRLRSNAIGCTGEPHCNFAVAETKGRLGTLIEHLEGRFGNDVSELRLHLDGCPHACGQHWVGDLGFQGTTVRDAEGKRHQGYDILLRGALGPVAAIGRPVFRRVPTEELNQTVESLIVAWLDAREPGESFRAYCDRTTDDELGVLIGREPAKSRRGAKDPEEEAA